MTPHTTFSLTLHNILAPQYHVTLTSAKYEVLCHFKSTDTSSLACRASLPSPSTLDTSALLASSSPSWIIDSKALSHRIETSLILSSYHPTPPIPHYHCQWSIVSSSRPWYYSCHPLPFSLPNPLSYQFLSELSLH